MKILFVDDSKAVHSFLKDCFSGGNHDLHHAYSGEEAMEKMGSEDFELILLDWEMPGMKGPDVVEAMKEKGISFPVVMLTSRNSIDDITMMLGKGVSEYIMKPFTQDIVFEKIEFVLGKKIA